MLNKLLSRLPRQVSFDGWDLRLLSERVEREHAEKTIEVNRHVVPYVILYLSRSNP